VKQEPIGRFLVQIRKQRFVQRQLSLAKYEYSGDHVMPISRRPQTKVIDVHAHVIPPGGNYPQTGEWNESIALAFMDKHEIDFQFLSWPVALAPDESRKMNDFVAGIVARHPTRFGQLANVPLTDPDAALREIDRARVDLRAGGFFLPSSFNGHYWGGDVFDPILCELDRQKATIFLHPAYDETSDALNLGRAPNLIEVAMNTARSLTNAIYAGVFSRLTQMKVIVAHAGGTMPILAPRLFALGTLPWISNPNGITVQDMKDQLASLYYDLGIAGSHATLYALTQLTEPSHIVFGTDYPPAGAVGISDNIESIKSFCEMSSLLNWPDIAGQSAKLFPSIFDTSAV